MTNQSRSLVAPVTIGNATLYCGDCYDLLETFDTSNTLISDVPYGMKCNTDNTRFSGGNSQRVDSANAMRNGWPKCCGYTMTIDSPAEQRPSKTGEDKC